MRLGTLRIKNNLMREYLYDLNDFFTFVTPAQCYEMLKPHGVHILHHTPSRFIPSVYREGDFKRDWLRFYSHDGGEMVFKMKHADDIRELIREVLTPKYNEDKVRLKRYLVGSFRVDLSV